MTNADITDCVYPRYADLIDVLKLAWDSHCRFTQACPIWKVKCLSVQVFSKVGIKLNAECDLEMLDLAIHDEAEEVQNEALMSLPMIILCSGPSLLEDMFKRLE